MRFGSVRTLVSENSDRSLLSFKTSTDFFEMHYPALQSFYIRLVGNFEDFKANGYFLVLPSDRNPESVYPVLFTLFGSKWLVAVKEYE